MRKTLAAFFIIFVCQSAVAAPNCQAIFGGEAPVFRSLAEKQAQVEEWLAPISASVVPQFSLLSLVSRFQERLLLLRMDSAQLGNPQFREWFVKSLVTIRMRAYSRPFAEFALSRDSAKQQAIERLVVQSLLENGLRNWPLGTTPKNEKSPGVYKKIWEQKNHLNMIINLLEQFKDDKSFAPIVQDLKTITDQEALIKGVQVVDIEGSDLNLILEESEL